MKKILFFSLLLMVAGVAFSQSPVEVAPGKAHHLKKSKNQKMAAISLVAGGGILTLIGIASWSNGFSDGLDFSTSGSEAGSAEMKSANAFFIAGGALILGSIPLLIASAKSKLRGMNLSFKKETATLVQNKSFVYRSVPSITLKISL